MVCQDKKETKESPGCHAVVLFVLRVIPVPMDYSVLLGCYVIPSLPGQKGEADSLADHGLPGLPSADGLPGVLGGPSLPSLDGLPGM